MSLPVPAFMGGKKAISMTPVVGTPRREYAEMFIPGEEQLEDGEMRVTVLGSGNPWNTRAQASASILVEVGNPERDIFVFDIGSGCLANYASLKLPINKLNKVFLSHLHADHTGDLITLSGSWSKVGRADGPVYVWGPSGTEPHLGTRHFVEGIEEALAWDTAAGAGAINPESMKIVVSEFDFSKTQVVYDEKGVKVTSFPVVQTQDLTVFNVTKEAVIARQAKQFDQLPPMPGKQRMAFAPVAVAPPDWWAEAIIPLD